MNKLKFFDVSLLAPPFFLRAVQITHHTVTTCSGCQPSSMHRHHACTAPASVIGKYKYTCRHLRTHWAPANRTSEREMSPTVLKHYHIPRAHTSSSAFHTLFSSPIYEHEYVQQPNLLCQRCDDQSKRHLHSVSIIDARRTVVFVTRIAQAQCELGKRKTACLFFFCSKIRFCVQYSLHG